MEFNRNQKTLAGIILLTGTLAAIVMMPAFLNQGVPAVCVVDGECQHEMALEQLITLTPAILFAGITLGAVSFYFLYERSKAPASRAENVSQFVGVMEKGEAAVMGKIISEGGRVLQAELSRIEGLGKVRAHRIVQRLEKRGVLEVESAGKTNVVKLTREYRELFLGSKGA